MEETLILKVPFNEKSARHQLETHFKHVWKKALDELKRTVIYLIVFSILFFLSYNGNSGIHYIFLVAIVLFISGLYFTLFNYFKSKKAFNKKVNEMVEDHQSINDVAIITLSKEGFALKNNYSESKILWSKTSYEMIEDVLILYFANSPIAYLFDDIEMGKEDFGKLRDFVANKSKEHKV